MKMPAALALGAPAAPPAPTGRAAPAGRAGPVQNGFSDLLDGRHAAGKAPAGGRDGAAQAGPARGPLPPGRNHHSDDNTGAAEAARWHEEGATDRPRRKGEHHRDHDGAATVPPAPTWLQHALPGHVVASGRQGGSHERGQADMKVKGIAAAGAAAKQNGRIDAATILKQAAEAPAASSAAAAQPAGRAGDAAKVRVAIAGGDTDHPAVKPETRLEAMVAERISPTATAGSVSRTPAKDDTAHPAAANRGAEPSGGGLAAGKAGIDRRGDGATIDPKAKAGRHGDHADQNAARGRSGDPSGPAGKPERAAEPHATAASSQAGPPPAAAPSALQPLPPGGPAAANSASFLSAIGANEGWSRYLQRVEAASPVAGANGTALPVQALKIELHPAGLGMITAHLHASDKQLKIEVEVRTDEAHRRLSADGDAILKSLRAAGFDAGSLVIRHVADQSGTGGTAIGAPPGQGSDGSARFSASGGSGRNDGGAGGQRNMGYGHGSEADQKPGRHGRDPDRGGGGVYI